MEEEKLIREKAPPDDSTYFEGEPAVKEEGNNPQGIEEFPFAEMMKEMKLYE